MCAIPAILSLLLLLPAGCHSAGRSEQPLNAAPARDTWLAQHRNQQGLQAIENEDFEAAEAAFRGSLEADCFYGPAHNNLGLVLLHQGKPYQSAWEFTWAAKLMPQAAEPRGNLGLLFEQVGRPERALEEYRAALDVDPDDLQAMQHLARTMIKARKHDPELRELLERICLRSEEQDWNDWARAELLKLGRDE